MAVNWQSENSVSARDALKRRILPACLAAALLIGGINLIAGWLVDEGSRKVAANQFVSPWDKKQIPPVLRTSHVVAKAKIAEPLPVVAPQKASEVKHRAVRRHHWRKHWSSRVNQTAANTGYPCL